MISPTCAAGILAGALIAATTSHATSTPADPVQKVDSALLSTIAADNLAYEVALARGDARAAAAPYEASAIFIGPGPHILIGRAQIQAHIAAILAKVHFVSGTCRTDHLSQDGDQAYEAGHCNSIVEIHARKVASGGDYLTVWRRQKNGAWLIEINAAP
jgi:ketosteroid isomerase-like protein